MTKVTSGKTLYEQVVERIKDMIAQGLYPKGSLLPSEKELMEMMGVGRITVREALRILSEAGVIQTVKGKGSFVQISCAEMRADETQQNYQTRFLESTDLRLLLEPAVAREVALHCDEAQRQAIGDCLHRSGETLENFHRTIITATRNHLLIELFDQLSALESFPSTSPTLIPPFRQKSVSSKLQSQHERIYQAILEGNGEYAYFYMKEHMEFVKKTYEEFFNMLCS